MSDLENQMGLFELEPVVAPEIKEAAPQPKAAIPATPAPPAPAARPEPVREPVREAAAKTPQRPAAKTAARAPARKRGRQPKGAVKAVSGLVPEGDVRLTANIREDLHLKLKIASAYRRTTIGEILEELIEKYV